MRTSFCHIIWFFRKLAAAALIEEAGSWRQRNDLEGSDAARSLCTSHLMDLFSHWGGMRFFLRRCALMGPLVALRAFFLVGGSAAAIVGATVAL
jgi:hypothetical protein